MAEKIEKTETVVRTFDDAGKLAKEVTTTVVTLIPDHDATPQIGQYL